MNPKNIGTQSHYNNHRFFICELACYMTDEDAKIVCQFYKVQLKDARGVLTNVKQSIKSKGCLQGVEVMIINMCPSCKEAGSARPAGLTSKATQ